MSKGLYLWLWIMLTPAIGQAGVDMSKLQGLGEISYHQLPASDPQQPPYHIYVRLPAEAKADPARRLPTVYLLDGGANFAALAGYYHYLRLGEEVPPLILVGISYGTDDWRKGNRRSHDYTLPSAEREHWGGAEAFDQWLQQRLIPLVESTYPSDPDRRVLFGQSLGGQFVLHEAMFRPWRFWGHIASNAALHGNLERFLADADRNPDSLPLLFVSGGSEDTERFAEPRARWVARWREHPDPPFRLKVVELSGETHFSALTTAFRQGLRWLFPAAAPVP